MLPSEPREQRPSYVTFERTPVEDRAASRKSGSYKTRDVDFAIITPVGSKDRIPREVTPWFEQLQVQARDGRIPSDWPDKYRRMYDAWKAGQEVPVDGTPIKGWPVLSPAQQVNIIGSDVRTVEDLAQINEETQRRIGIGALEFRDKAITWLKAAKGPGVVVKEMEALKVQNKALEEQVAAQGELLKELQIELKRLSAHEPA